MGLSSRKPETESQEYARLVREQEKRDRKNRRLYGPPTEPDDDNPIVGIVGGPGASTTFYSAFFGG
ncbi:hypothetical protein [Streptomyces sp. NPDC088794]|uniref:hypothetical protein n=1 Tax=Streptomyces sp. NPDC088794 TaxID=3365902 RepID=UPI00380184E1